VILSPTRELAGQTKSVVDGLSYYLKISSYLSTGGTPVMSDKKAFQEGKQIVVGTPGRIVDMITRGYLDISGLKIIVLDEADDLLGRGFLEQINMIIKNVPPSSQACFFSATMPNDVIELSKSIMDNPVQILVKNDELTLEGIKQFYIACSTDEAKFDNIMQLFSCLNISQGMIYVNTCEKAE
jgi:superfamily II DNA/RNA helicase